MVDKKCVSCNKTKYGIDYSTNSDIPDWVKKSEKQASIIPEYYMPKIENIVRVDIDIKELRNSLIFYWATESKKMKNVTNNKNNCEPECHPKYAYGNYCNSGITKLDKNGKAIIYIEEPIPYITEGEQYYPHLHFTTFDKKNNRWNEEVYTISV